MKNIERQKSLDKKKWIASEKAGEDMSGKKPWCVYCRWVNFGTCYASQEERESKCLCATAYNRMQRKGGKNG